MDSLVLNNVMLEKEVEVLGWYEVASLLHVTVRACESALLLLGGIKKLSQEVPVVPLSLWTTRKTSTP